MIKQRLIDLWNAVLIITALALIGLCFGIFAISCLYGLGVFDNMVEYLLARGYGSFAVDAISLIAALLVVVVGAVTGFLLAVFVSVRMDEWFIGEVFWDKK